MATFDGFGVKLTPDELRSLNERVAPNLNAFLAFSRGTRAEVFGNDAEAVAAFQEAASLDKQFTLAQTKLAAARQRVTAHPAAGAASGATKAATEKEDPKDATPEKPDAKAIVGSPVGGSAPGGSLAAPSATAATAAAAEAKKGATPKPSAKKSPPPRPKATSP